MSQPLKNVLIIGGSGNIGSNVLSAVSATKDQFNISVLVRNSSGATFPDDVAVFRTRDDYPESDIMPAFKGQDAVISTISFAALGQQKSLVELAVKAGVKRFIPSEFGADPSNERNLQVMPSFFGTKKEVLDHLRSVEGKGLSWTVIANGPNFDFGVKTGFLGFDTQKHTAQIWGSGDTKWATTNMPTVGLAVKQTLLKPAETANKTLFISSFNISQNEVVKALENLQGVKYKIEHMDPEEGKAKAQQALANGDIMNGFMGMVRYISYVPGYGNDYGAYAESANDMLELPKETVEDTLKTIVKA